MKGLDELFVVAWMLFGIYIEVFIMILADLWSGVRKAKVRGEVRSSFMYKKTTDKITITQLPTAYEGALVSDGVDDYGKCVGLPILDDFTLICKRKILNASRGYVATKAYLGSGAFYFEADIRPDTVYSYGAANRVKLEESEVSWMTKNSYNGIELKTGNSSDADKLYLCAVGAGHTKAAIYYFALYNKSLTIEEIETEKERLNEEWLKRKN